MRGMDQATGRWLDDDAHLAQSIARILTTPLGTRLQRRDFGSLLPELVDQPFNSTTQLRLYGAAATALMRWEPRIQITQLALAKGERPGAFVLDVTCRRIRTQRSNEFTRLTVPLRYRET